MLNRILILSAIGVGVATFYSALAAVMYLAAPSVFERNNLRLWQVVVVYYTMLPLGGCILGIGMKLGRRRWGAMLLGAIALFPLYAACAILLLPKDQWVPQGVLVSLVASAMVGGPLGAYGWRLEHR